MTDAVSAFALVLPAGNGASTQTKLECPLGWSNVTQIDLVFPPGCLNLVGVQVLFAENAVYPIRASTFFVLDDDRLQLPITNQGQSGQWELNGYNQDYYQHTIQVYFYFDYIIGDVVSTSGLVSL